MLGTQLVEGKTDEKENGKDQSNKLEEIFGKKESAEHWKGIEGDQCS